MDRTVDLIYHSLYSVFDDRTMHSLGRQPGRQAPVMRSQRIVCTFTQALTSIVHELRVERSIPVYGHAGGFHPHPPLAVDNVAR